MPAPPRPPPLPIDKDATVVQFAPSYVSVAFEGLFPPMAKPAVCVPAPARCCLAVFKFPPAVQEVPSYSSVDAEIEGGVAG